MNLEAFDFFARLEPSAREYLLANVKPVRIAEGTILFYQGDVCDTILWLTSGKVRLYSQAEGIEAITLYTLNPGQQCIVNTASAISGSSAIGSAVTVTDIEGYIVATAAAKKLAHISDVYQEYLFSLYTLRMGALVTLVNDLKFKRLDQRVLQWLERQSEKTVTITHEALAAELGSSRVVISRVLKELEASGKVRLERGAITLRSAGEG